MRTTLDIDEELLERAMKLTDFPTKTRTVEEGLRELIRCARREGLKHMAGEGYGLTRDEFLDSRRDE